MKFNGSDYVPEIDNERLSEQHLRIKDLMLDKKWRTLKEISKITSDPEASISAQLRHLRKKRFGSWVIEKKSRGDRSNGLFEYRLMPSGYDSEFVIQPRQNKYKEALEAVWKKYPDTRKTIKEFFK